MTGLGLLTGGAAQSAPDNFSTEIQNNVNANGRSFDANLYVVDGRDPTIFTTTLPRNSFGLERGSRTDIFRSSAANFTRSLQISETHTFSPTMLNEAGLGYLALEGITNVSGPFHVPAVTLTGQSTMMGVTPAHQDFSPHNYHWRDMFNIIHRSHTLRFGYEGFQGDELTLFAQQYNQPAFTLTSLLAFVQDSPRLDSSTTLLLDNPHFSISVLQQRLAAALRRTSGK